MQERPIPETARRDPNSVEMLRLWIAEQSLWCSIKVGMYEDTPGVAEEKAWGTILADATRHTAAALAKEYGAKPDTTIALIRRAYLDELDEPTSEATGEFV
jgi:hypothetical protein